MFKEFTNSKSTSIAEFFLERNSWNVAEAVGKYLTYDDMELTKIRGSLSLYSLHSGKKEKKQHGEDQNSRTLDGTIVDFTKKKKEKKMHRYSWDMNKFLRSRDYSSSIYRIPSSPSDLRKRKIKEEKISTDFSSHQFSKKYRDLHRKLRETEKERRNNKKKDILITNNSNKNRKIKDDKNRYAFIAGQNQDDPNPLYYAWSDCARVCARLEEFGYECTKLFFRVSDKKKLTYSRFRSSFIRFCKKLKKNDHVIIYYSGHGYQKNGKNFLQCMKNEENIEDMELSFLIQKLRVMETINFVFLDCCQDDPQDETWKKKDIRVKGKNEKKKNLPNPITGGDDCVVVEGGQFVFAFSCLPGLRSLENRGGGVFTNSLLKFLSLDVEVHSMLRKVNNDMIKTIGQVGCVISTASLDLFL